MDSSENEARDLPSRFLGLLSAGSKDLRSKGKDTDHHNYGCIDLNGKSKGPRMNHGISQPSAFGSSRSPFQRFRVNREKPRLLQLCWSLITNKMFSPEIEGWIMGYPNPAPVVGFTKRRIKGFRVKRINTDHN